MATALLGFKLAMKRSYRQAKSKHERKKTAYQYKYKLRNSTNVWGVRLRQIIVSIQRIRQNKFANLKKQQTFQRGKAQELLEEGRMSHSHYQRSRFTSEHYYIKVT